MAEETHAVAGRTVFEFADLTLDVAQRAVFRGAVRIALPKLSYALLHALVDAAPDLLTPDAVAERVWRGRPVTPETLTQRVLLLRRALGDDARAPRYLRVVRGLGFQLVPPIRHGGTAARRAPPAATRAGAAARAAEPGDFVGDIDLSLPAQPSIVVLPFATDDDPGHGNLARGMTHDIVTRIGRTRALFVIARGSTFSFAPGVHDVREVARRLGVRYVVQGHIQFDGRRMRVNAALADAVEGREIWAEAFRRGLDDLFDTQEELTALIVAGVCAEVDLEERRRALLERPASLDAWSAYHRACWHMYRFTPADYEQAERLFELSADLDPRAARTFAGLSFVHWQRAFLEIAPDRAGEIRQAFEFARQSVALDPRDPLGHWALGRAHLMRGELDEAIAELGTATALNPSFAVGHYSQGFALMHAGETAPSIRMADRARRLSPYDPMSFAMIGLRGFSLALAGEYGAAARHLARSIRLPNAHHNMVAMAAVCDVLAGDVPAARRDLRRLRQARAGYGAREFLRAFPLRKPAHAALVESAFARLDRLR